MAVNNSITYVDAEQPKARVRGKKEVKVNTTRTVPSTGELLNKENIIHRRSE